MNEGQNGGFNGSAVNFGAQNNAGVQPTASPMPVQPVMPATQQPIMSSGEGDVILGGGAPEKKSRGGVIALIVLIILVALAGGGYALWQSGVFGGGSGNNNAETVVLDKSQVAFNKYANDFLYGEAKTDTIAAEMSGSRESYFRTMIDADEVSKEYLTGLQQYFDEFYDTFEGEMSEMAQRLDQGEDQAREYESGWLDEYRAKLELVALYYGGEPLTWGGILSSYANGGTAAAENLITHSSEPYEEIGEVYGMNYYEMLQSWAKDSLALIAQYDGMGCVGGGEVDYGCVVEKSDEAVKTTADKVSGELYNLITIREDSENDLYDQIFMIKEELRVEV